MVIRYGIREISPIDCLDPPHFLRNDSAEATLKLDVKQAVNTPSERLTKVKRLLKLVISAGFYLLILLRDSVCKMLGGRPHGTCVVLGYHAIPAEVRSRFAWQMDELLNYSTAIAANSRMRLHAGERFTAVTFDDGFLSVVENAVPELVSRRIPATFFVVADYLGAAPDWGTFNSDYVANEKTVSVNDLRNLPDDLLTIGSHTASHPWLPALPEAQARIELSKSREVLSKLLNRDVTLFSFPYGAQNEELARLCREVGYERVFTTIPKLAFTDPEEYVTGRVRVDPFDWPVEFRLKLLGAYSWLSWAFHLKHQLFSRLFSANGRDSKNRAIRFQAK